MPLYSYRCNTCDTVFEVERPLGDLEKEACPACGKESSRVFTVFEEQPEIGGGACSLHHSQPKIFEE